mmetsp:Transcript_55501/g.152654  ORF Transcript_55501/g.152654 Transcript_55501/m.152654 type:complete len:223 (+) Transcript_55501:345-1013(+)
MSVLPHQGRRRQQGAHVVEPRARRSGRGGTGDARRRRHVVLGQNAQRQRQPAGQGRGRRAHLRAALRPEAARRVQQLYRRRRHGCLVQRPRARPAAQPPRSVPRRQPDHRPERALPSCRRGRAVHGAHDRSLRELDRRCSGEHARGGRHSRASDNVVVHRERLERRSLAAATTRRAEDAPARQQLCRRRRRVVPRRRAARRRAAAAPKPARGRSLRGDMGDR